jgi:RNA polymerase sigma-70 factor, ECF subfamily
MGYLCFSLAGVAKLPNRLRHNLKEIFMNVTTAETKPVEQLEDALRSTVLEMTTVVTERLPYFRYVALRRLQNAADAEDAVQDAFLSAWKHLGQFNGDAAMATWLTAIVTNSARTIVRKRSQMRPLELERENEDENKTQLVDLVADSRPDPEAQFERLESEIRLHRLLACLPPGLRVVVHLQSVEGLSVREIAKTLGLTVSAVKARAWRARAELRRLERKTSHQCLPTSGHAVRAAKGSAALLHLQ